MSGVPMPQEELGRPDRQVLPLAMQAAMEKAAAERAQREGQAPDDAPVDMTGFESIAPSQEAPKPIVERQDLPWHKKALLLDPKVRAAQARLRQDPDQLAWDALLDPKAVHAALSSFPLRGPRVAEEILVRSGIAAGSYALAERYLPPIMAREVGDLVARGRIDDALAALKGKPRAILRDPARFIATVLRAIHPGAPHGFQAPRTS